MNQGKECTDVLTRLKIISMLRHSEKFLTKGNIIRIDPGGVLQGIRRYIGGESRKENLERIEALMDRTFSIICSKDRHSAELLIKELRNVSDGLRNLRTTYESDSTMKARISVLLDRIEQVVSNSNSSNSSSSLKKKEVVHIRSLGS